MNSIEKLVKDYDGQVVKALRTYQNTKEWTQYAEEFKGFLRMPRRLVRRKLRRFVIIFGNTLIEFLVSIMRII